MSGLTWGSGTLGDSLELSRDDEAPLVCGMNCHHIRRPVEVVIADPMTQTILPTPGTPPYDPILDEEGRLQPAIEAKMPRDASTYRAPPPLPSHGPFIFRSMAEDEERISELGCGHKGTQ